MAATATGTGPDAARGLKGKTFSSPADRTVVTAPSGAGAGAAARAQDAQGSSYLAIYLDATTPSAHSIELTTRVSSEAAELDVTIDWGDGTTDKATASSTGYDRRQTNHKYAAVGSYTVTVTVKDTTHGVQAVNELKFVTSGNEFTSHAPTRLLDTRAGLGAAKAKVAGRSSVALKVAGAAKVPAGVRAVVLNVTVTNTTGPGHISVQQDKDLAEGAETSNVNYVAGQSVPNLVIAPVGEDGYVHLFNAGWESVDLIADVTGSFSPAPAAGYGALTPTRAVDTREGVGTAKGQVPGYGTFGVEIAGRGGVPKGATAVALNLTATNPRADGHLTAYPSGQAAPATSNLNFTAGRTIANSVIVPIGPDGKITVRNGSWAPADVVIDVVGYYTPDSRSAFVSAWVPMRMLDTRKDYSWGLRKAGPVAGRTYEPMQLEADTTTPVVDGWALNTTVTNTTGTGFLSVTGDPNFWSDYQKGTAVTPQRPVSSALNWTAGATVPNLVQTPGGKGGMVDFWNQGWENIDLLVDLTGYYQTV
ncbi:PKD domain-containing protein [Streptomyces sp. NPDC048258]|uniref:PKD domain-containing protein n=1 Tax=Streptomyces sp. NPDC048258 TaxID=3365527 RepID=UPI00371D0F4B